MFRRRQQTLAGSAVIEGFGLFTNSDVTVRILPADGDHGIVFQRIDLPGQPLIPGTIEYLAAEERRTKLANGSASIEMTEHLLAALAGLHIDNCLVQVDAPELPGCDGSSLDYVTALLEAGIVQQAAIRKCLAIESPIILDDPAGPVLEVHPNSEGLRIEYDLDYGANSCIPAQRADFSITPGLFASQIAPARTFVLEQEIEYLRSRGFGQKVTMQDLLVFDKDGPIENELRAPNECARHKLLDCVGDLALCGFDIQGKVRAFRSGHKQNHELARVLKSLSDQTENDAEQAA